jgi:FkbM family methyltransferase
VTTRFGARVKVNARDIVGRYISYFGVWEPNLTLWLERTLRPGDVFVDVGANIGYFSLLASKLVGPAGMVVAVEAVPETAEELRTNVRLNRASNIRVVEAAAWHESDTLQLHVGDEMSGTATADHTWARRWNLARTIKAEAAPLDALLSRDEVARARVIKIDVEGAELSVIRGMAQLLTSGRPSIVVEVAPGLPGKGWPELQELLTSRGYESAILENDYSPAAYWRLPSEPRFLCTPRSDAEQFDVVFYQAAEDEPADADAAADHDSAAAIRKGFD